jgi:uncharacterized protein (TIRG00374 family)
VQQATSRRVLTATVKVAIAAVLLFLVLRQMKWGNVRDAFRGIRWWWFALALFLHFPGYLISAWRWRILLRAQGQHIPFWKLVESYVVATFFNYTMLGTLGGDVVRMADTGLGRKRGAQAASAVFLERLTGLAALVLLAGLGMALIALVGGEPSAGRGLVPAALALFAVFCVGLYALTHPRVVDAAARLLDRPWPLFGAAHRIVLKLKSALAVFHDDKRPVYANLAWALLLQVNVAAHYFCLGLAMGLPDLYSAPLRCAFNYMMLVPLITLILMIPITPGGAGVREWTLRGLRRGLGFAPTAAGADRAVTMGWLQVASALVYGAVGFVLFLTRSLRAKQDGVEQKPGV